MKHPIGNLLCLAIIMTPALLQESTIMVSAVGIVQTFKDVYGYFYKVSGFGLTVPGEYNVTNVNSFCDCKRKCQVWPPCHSVTAIPKDDGTVECRMSNLPGDIGKRRERPSLAPISGAFHYLQTTPELWEMPSDDGLFYYLNSSSTRDNTFRCPGRYRFASCRSIQQFEVIKKFIDESGSAGMHIYLTYRPQWQGLHWGPNEKAYEDTGLDTSLIATYDLSSPVYFKAVPSGNSYLFVPSQPDETLPLLCQANDLRIYW